MVALRDKLRAEQEAAQARKEAKKKRPSKAKPSEANVLDMTKHTMPDDDPLIQMLPAWSKIKLLKWYPRQPYEMTVLSRSGHQKETIYTSQAKVIREFLCDPRPAHCDRKGRNRFLQLINNQFEIGMGKSPQATKATEFLLDRGFGKAKPSEEELDANRRTGYQIIVMPQAQLNVPVEEMKALEPPKPDFIDADFSTTEVQ